MIRIANNRNFFELEARDIVEDLDIYFDYICKAIKRKEKIDKEDLERFDDILKRLLKMKKKLKCVQKG